MEGSGTGADVVPVKELPLASNASNCTKPGPLALVKVKGETVEPGAKVCGVAESPSSKNEIRPRPESKLAPKPVGATRLMTVLGLAGIAPKVMIARSTEPELVTA